MKFHRRGNSNSENSSKIRSPKLKKSPVLSSGEPNAKKVPPVKVEKKKVDLKVQRKKVPEVPLRQQVLALIDSISVTGTLERHSVHFLDYASTIKKEYIKEIEKTIPGDDRILESMKEHRLLEVSPAARYIRSENFNFREFGHGIDEDQLFDLQIRYPTISSIPTRASRLRVKGSSIVNITDSSEHHHLFENQRRRKIKRPVSMFSQSSEASASAATIRADASKRLKRFSAKAKRISQVADEKLNNRVRQPKIYEDAHGSTISLSSDIAKINNINTSLMSQQQKSQRFVKYHIYSFAPDRMVLTTNPDRKHVYCKFAPGYTVEIQSPSLTVDQQNSLAGGKSSDRGFRLIFRSINYSEDRPEIVVTKKSKIKGGEYMVWIVKQIKLSDSNEYETTEDGKREYWQSEAHKAPFIETYFNSELQNSLQRADPKKIMNRYEVHDIRGLGWTVGSIPKIKSSNFGKIKHISRDLLKETSTENTDGSKITHKHDVYFFTKSKTDKLKVQLPDLGSISKHEATVGTENYVLGTFRPHETRLRKKLGKDLKRLKMKSMEQYYINQEDTSYNFNAMDDLDNSEKTTHAEEPKTEVFYQPGDGILEKYTPDDSPNDFKLGWLTIYNEQCLKEPGMFELVLAMTVAVGYERVINE